MSWFLKQIAGVLGAQAQGLQPLGFASRFAILLTLALPLPSTQAELTFEPSWALPTYESVRQQTFQELNNQKKKQAQAIPLWPAVELRSISGANLLDRVAETFCLFDNRAAKLVEACNSQHVGPLPPEGNWLFDDTNPEFFRNNLRLYLARWLAQHAWYDEVLSTLEGLKTDQVVDPAGLLFYRMIAHQQLVQPEQSRAVLAQLLQREEQLPQRYLQMAQLIKQDLANLDDDSLDHVARRMNDVRRRLELGRAGKQVQIVERGVLDSLDKLIKKAEEEQQKQQQSSSSSPGGSKPMQDSRPTELKAPGQVDPRDIGSKSGWGDLPPKERERALQQIGREFPSHYRDLIQEYFRELADEGNTHPSK